ncbi:hypothetical protein OsI_06261 [Oryza sativa Indica Group]|uniref:peptidylprolyl isomerase n=1 Tax=Oryza sativa subsp. indica TaxID=39946 RepID=B8ADS9_ORYSI|nr:hypothetical protein OsI_06261 [Oryza sativa Indica Group]
MAPASLTRLTNPLPCASPSPRCRRRPGRSPPARSAACGVVSRRRAVSEMAILSGAAAAAASCCVDLFFAHMPARAATLEPDVIRYRKLDSGVKLEDVVDGEGPEAREGDVVQFNYVCRRANGYFVHSTVDQFSGESKPVTLALDGKEMIRGLKDVIVGMKTGGKRRALIPPQVSYTDESLQPIPEEFGPRRSLLSHAKEPLVFEVQLLKVL